MNFQTTVDIAAPPDVVWPVIAAVEAWCEWTPSVRSIRRLGGGPLDVGSRALVRQPRLPPALWTVSALEPGAAFTWVTWSPGVTVVADHRVVAAPGGSRVTLAVRFEGLLAGVLGRLTRGLNERYLALEAAGLKARCEARARRTPNGAIS